MKTQTHSVLKKLSMLLSMAALAMTVTACGNKGAGNSDDDRDHRVVNPNCSGCVGNNVLLSSGIGESYFMGNQIEARLTLNLYGSNVGTYGGTYGYGGGISGTAAVTGRFEMFLPYATSYCGVPAGTYNVTTTTAGTTGGLTFGNMELLASGPTQVRIWVPDGALKIVNGRVDGIAYMNIPNDPACALIIN